MTRLEQWSVGKHKRDQYAPPELAPPCLRGIRPDGDRITTSPIVGTDGDFIVTKSGSLYELGEVDPAYEAQFPNARQRLFDNYAQGETK